MALDIGLGTSAWDLDRATSLSFDDDGYYWFLHPLFEQLRDRTGQYIDLYGRATFDKASLAALSAMLLEARRRVELQPAAWDVCVGHNMGSYLQPVDPPTPIYAPVEKTILLTLIARFEALVEKARLTGKQIICIGD